MLSSVYGLITAPCLKQWVLPPPPPPPPSESGRRCCRLGHGAPSPWSPPELADVGGRPLHHPRGPQRSSGPDVIRFWPCSCGAFGAAFPQSAAAFHHPAGLQFALPAMPIRSAASLLLPLCQFSPAVPVLQLAHMRSLPSPLAELLCNSVQTGADCARLSSLKLK